MKSVRLIAIGSAMALFMACNHADKNTSSVGDSLSIKNSAAQTADSLRNSLDKDKSELKAKLDTLIVEADAKIDTLDKKMYMASAKERKRLYADKVKMQERRDELKRDLNEVDRKVDTDWKKFKETVSAAIDSLKADL